MARQEGGRLYQAAVDIDRQRAAGFRGPDTDLKRSGRRGNGFQHGRNRK